MKKIDFVKNVTEKVRTTGYFDDIKFAVTQKETEAYLFAIRDTICEAMANGDDVLFPGLVKFTVADVAARVGRNPQTGEPINIPAKKKVKAKILGDLKNSVL